MIDFHTHILPAVDDGSKNADESIKMLKMLKSQGAELVIATPHFLANQISVDDFLLARDNAFKSIKAIKEDLPDVLLGAEVKYYEGISRLANIEKLCIGDSKVILVEMYMSKWSKSAVNELIQLSNRSGFRVVIAHVERYMGFQSKDVINSLLDADVLFQVNASFFTSFATRRKAIRMIMNNQIHFVGSDCHNLSDRPPNIDKAFAYIRSRLGDDFVNRMNCFGYSVIKGN